MIAGARSWIGRGCRRGGEYTPGQVGQQCIATLCEGVLRRVEAPAGAGAPKTPRKSRRSSSAPLAGN